MISYYQELLNECIDIQEHKQNLAIMKKIRKFIKGEEEMLSKKNKEIKQQDIEHKESETIKQLFNMEDFAKDLLFTSRTELQEKGARSLVNRLKVEMKTLYVYPQKQNA